MYTHFTTNLGKFTVELFEKDTPKTVANFVGLAKETDNANDPKTGAKVEEAVLQRPDLSSGDCGLHHSGRQCAPAPAPAIPATSSVNK